MDDLNKDDIVIVDEAHVLFYNYIQPNGTYQFYERVIQNLYRTEAKVVLMSGTPNLSLLSMLNLKHVNIIKPNGNTATLISLGKKDITWGGFDTVIHDYRGVNSQNQKVET